jgi:competence protein ComEA
VPEQPASVTAVLASARWNPGRRGALALAVVALVAALVAGFVLLRSRPSGQPLTVPRAVGGAAVATGAELVVDVAGRVRRPGLVRLAVGARVDDALRAAGGVLPGVRTDALNLARKLADGEQVLVGVAAPAAGPGSPGLLNLNTATASDIEQLPGIGPVLAQKIVDWRTEHQRFASVDQLREVSGIGESKFAGLRTKVTV